MKHIVVMSGLRESDIRPPELFKEFKRVSVEESLIYFRDPSVLVEVVCPACGTSERVCVFEKHGFQYNRCTSCSSVFVSPRPSEEALAEYYRESRAARFRETYYLEETAEARHFLLLRSRVNWVGRIVEEAGNPEAGGFADLGTVYPHILDEVKRLGLFKEVYAVEPFVRITSEETSVHEGVLRNLSAVTAFEHLEHKFSPLDLVEKAFDMLAGGGVFFLTTRTISGFDLQVLWDKAPYIFVPEHLNLLSLEGLERLIDRAGLRLIELSTPGQLDVELVLRAQREDATIDLAPFVDYVLNKRGAETHIDFQRFLQRNRLSSHVRLAAIR